MKRLNQLVTRLLIIALIALAAWVGRTHLGKKVIEYHIRSFVGANVVASQLDINRDDGSMFLSELEVADPNFEMRNSLQFEAASLMLDVDQLKNRRLVITEGRLSEVKFGAPRTTSGRLNRGIFDPPLPKVDSVREENFVKANNTQPSTGDSYSSSKRFQDELLVDLSQNGTQIESNFRVGPMVDKLSQQWSKRFAEPTESLQDVAIGLAKLEKEVFSAPPEEWNPLRDRKKLIAAEEQLNEYRVILKKLTTTVGSFDSQSQKDRYELSQVQVQDQQVLVSTENVQKFDPKLINQILVSKIERELVSNGLQWFQQFRNSLPDKETDFRPLKRGRDLHFGKPATKASFEIKKMQIDGAAEFAGAHFKFAGTVENITENPKLCSEPIRFNLRAQGEPQVIVSGVLDRRGEQPKDTIEFTGNSIPQPEQFLGNGESVLLSMAGDSQLFVDATISISDGGRISGEMVFAFEEVMLHADSVHESAGGNETAALLNETVSGIKSFTITSNLGGTITAPESNFVCGLGQEVANSLEAVYVDAQQLVRRKKENSLNKTVNGKLAQLNSGITNGIVELNHSIRSNLETINRMKKRIAAAQGPSVERGTSLLR